VVLGKTVKLTPAQDDPSRPFCGRKSARGAFLGVPRTAAARFRCRFRAIGAGDNALKAGRGIAWVNYICLNKCV
jgi:hypothetical protein